MSCCVVNQFIWNKNINNDNKEQYSIKYSQIICSNLFGVFVLQSKQVRWNDRNDFVKCMWNHIKIAIHSLSIFPIVISVKIHSVVYE